MAREIDRLTPTHINELTKPGYHADGLGLHLQVTATQTKNWIHVYRYAGKNVEMGLGAYPLITIKQARALRDAGRRLLVEGRDPKTERDKVRAAAAAAREAAKLERLQGRTFEQAAREWFEDNKAKWTSEKNRQQWISSMVMYVFPRIGATLIKDISKDHVLAVLRPIWNERATTAKRVQGRIETVLTAEIVKEHRAGPNPAAWKNHLDHILPNTNKIAPVENFAALPYAQVPALMAILRTEQSMPALALEFTILTAQRSGSVLQANWSEFDLDAALWVVPAAHMKKRREHRVSLCPRAVEILRQLPRNGDVVFFGTKKGQSISKNMMRNTLEDMLKKMQFSGEATVHGFRSSFRDWCGEETQFQSDICEVALAHLIAEGDKTWLAYQRGDLLKKRRELMTAWSEFCGNPPAKLRVVAA
jgi:integrase